MYFAFIEYPVSRGAPDKEQRAESKEHSVRGKEQKAEGIGRKKRVFLPYAPCSMRFALDLQVQHGGIRLFQLAAGN
jgi:hypothetical protein